MKAKTIFFAYGQRYRDLGWPIWVAEVRLGMEKLPFWAKEAFRNGFYAR